MSLIKIDIAKCNDNRKQMQSRICDLTDLNEELDKLISDIDLYWDGEAGKRYVEAMRVTEKNAVQLIKILHEYKDSMEKLADAMYIVDKVEDVLNPLGKLSF